MKSCLALLVALTARGAPAQTASQPATAPAESAAPVIEADADIFVDSLAVTIRAARENVELRYTLDAAEPTAASLRVSGPVQITQTSQVRARAFRGEKPVSGVSQATFTKVTPVPAASVEGLLPGVRFDYYEGEWEKLPPFPRLTPVESGAAPNLDLSPRGRDDQFALRFQGYLAVPRTGVYRFWVRSDEGSGLYIGRKRVVDNDGLHSPVEASGVMALEAGAHSIALIYFERIGGELLEISYAGPGLEKQRIPDAALSHVAE